MTSLIKNAIRNRASLVVNYEPGIRVVEPHTLGITRTGKTMLRAYQTAGASASGEVNGWKLFDVSKMSNVEPDGSNFDKPRQGYVRGDSVMKSGIIAEL